LLGITAFNLDTELFPQAHRRKIGLGVVFVILIFIFWPLYRWPEKGQNISLIPKKYIVAVENVHDEDYKEILYEYNMEEKSKSAYEMYFVKGNTVFDQVLNFVFEFGYAFFVTNEGIIISERKAHK
jgi:hypothetical protein